MGYSHILACSPATNKLGGLQNHFFFRLLDSNLKGSLHRSNRLRRFFPYFFTVSQIETAKKAFRKHNPPEAWSQWSGCCQLPKMGFFDWAYCVAECEQVVVSFTFLFAAFAQTIRGRLGEDAAVPVGDKVRPRLHPQHRLDVSKLRRPAWSDCCRDSFGRYRATVHMGTSGQVGFFRWSKGWWFGVAGWVVVLNPTTSKIPGHKP